MKQFFERLKINADAFLREAGCSSLLSPVSPDFDSLASPLIPRNVDPIVLKKVFEKMEKVEKARNIGLKANSYLVYRQNLS